MMSKRPFQLREALTVPSSVQAVSPQAAEGRGRGWTCAGHGKGLTASLSWWEEVLWLNRAGSGQWCWPPQDTRIRRAIVRVHLVQTGRAMVARGLCPSPPATPQRGFRAGLPLVQPGETRSPRMGICSLVLRLPVQEPLLLRPHPRQSHAHCPSCLSWVTFLTLPMTSRKPRLEPWVLPGWEGM